MESGFAQRGFTVAITVLVAYSLLGSVLILPSASAGDAHVEIKDEVSIKLNDEPIPARDSFLFGVIASLAMVLTAVSLAVLYKKKYRRCIYPE